MKVYDKGILKSASVRAITDYPEHDGEYWVIRFNEETEEIESIEKVEFIQIDEDYESMYDGWNDMQYEVEHPRDHITYYWAERLELV